MENMIGAKALMIALEKEGVKEVFGIPGGATFQYTMNSIRVTYGIS